MLKKTLIASAAALAIGAFALGAPANAAESGVKVGVLTCNVDSGWGFVFGSSKDIRCNYKPDAGASAHYTGTINKYGVDIGFTEGGVLVWTVFAPTSDVGPDALEGDYAGASASATVGVGLGANVLVGGLDKSIALQPVSIEGNTGLNIAAGVSGVTLKYNP